MKQLIILLIIAGAVVMMNNGEEYVEIPSTSIRMRVIAASDSQEDQENKKVVKSLIEEKLYDLIKGSKSDKEASDIITNHKEEIDEEIITKMKAANIDSSYTSNFGYNYFPEKEFKHLRYKAGNYKSFVITLGSGKGENWWCVLYPPLCLVDENATDYEYHSLIKDTISKYN